MQDKKVNNEIMVKLGAPQAVENGSMPAFVGFRIIHVVADKI